jgi:glycosyltransferase involved in cell wall biosynthesis
MTINPSTADPLGLRLLAIGTDADLARPATAALSDAHQRQLKYASILRDYHMLVRTLGPPRFSIRHSRVFTAHASASRSRPFYPYDAFRLGSRIHRTVGFNLVSTEDPMLCGLAGYLLKRRFRLPLSVQLAGDMLDNPYWIAERRINPILNRLGKTLVGLADSARVVSTTERLKLIGLGVPPERIWNIGWISDFSQFVSAAPSDISDLRRRLLPQPYARLVLFVGRLVRQKDLPTLVRAARLVKAKRPDVRFVLLGGGPEEATVRHLAAQLDLGDRVVLAGVVPHHGLAAYYAACDVLALPSRYEGNARVLAEAAAAARPVVTTDVSGACDTVLDGQTGYVVPIGQPDQLARRLLQVLADPVAATEMGHAGREHVLRLYAEERVLAGFRDLWSWTAEQQAERRR